MINHRQLLTQIFQILQKDRYRNTKNESVSYSEYLLLKDNQRKYSGDEDTIVTPILLDILSAFGYHSGVNIIQQAEKKGDKPDFRTLATNLFILDAKSTNTDISNKGNNLKTPYNQISRYLASFKGYEFGILFNLTKFEFYKRFYDSDGTIKTKLLNDKTLNLNALLNLYLTGEFEESKDYKIFKWFVDTFYYTEIKKDQYIDIIKNRKPEELIVPDKDFLREIVYSLINKIRSEIRRQVDDFDEDGDEMLRLNHELKNIAKELNILEGESEREISLEEFIKQASYVVLLKIVLIRILEDNNLVDKNLYNGGFKKALEPPLNYTLHKILYDAKYQASNFYPYFYDGTTFDFQIEDDNLFIEILFELSKINFAEIDFDLIGDLYEHYLNIDDRKDKGQYYTPHFIVEFILNRVGCNPQSANKIIPKSYLDPACGSGGFLVEIARRYRRVGNNKEVEAKRAIVDSIHGIEITPFASFLAEINVVIQILPLVKRIENSKQQKISSLKIFRQDSLFHAYNRKEFNGEEDIKIIKSHVLAGDKELKFGDILNNNEFDFIIGNPPYVGEKKHKELFEPLKDHEYWKHFYQGRSDYLYYFIILGISKLKDGGHLGFITTQYWLTADSASNLRKYILEKTKIVEIIDFKGIKLFPEAKGQENIVFVLEKSENEEDRINNKIKIIEFKKDWVLSETKYADSLGNIVTNFDRWTELLTNQKQFEIFADVDKTNFMLGKDERNSIADVYYSVYSQGELDDNAWYLYSKDKEKNEYDHLTKLSDMFNVNQGIVSGADKVTKENIKRIPASLIQKNAIQVNDPIFVFNENQIIKLILNNEERNFVKPFYKNSDIKKGYVDISENQYVLYSDNIDELNNFPNIKQHLNALKYLLEDRIIRYGETYDWYKLHRARSKEIFENEKLVTSRRSKENRFAYENLKMYPQSDITIITKKVETKESLKYLLVLLNSTLLNSWYGNNTKLKGDMREYYFTPLSKMPIKKIDFDNEQEKEVHTLLGGIYSSTEIKNKSYKFDDVSKTWINEKGLIDFYMHVKNELYELKNSGFLFDPEMNLDSKTEIKVDLIALCKSTITKEIVTQFVEDVSIFESVMGKEKNIDKLNTVEKKEIALLIEKSSFIFKTNTKDFIIKSLTYKNLDSLFPDETDYKEYDFNYVISLKTIDNGSIDVEAKDKNKVKELAYSIENLLGKEKQISWNQIKQIPLTNAVLTSFIETKKQFIYEALKPVDTKVEKRLKEIFEKNDKLSFSKIKNLNYLQSLMDYYVDSLYNKAN